MKKQMEGDNKMRRRLARKAKELGLEASQLGMTTGASKQRTHLKGKSGNQHNHDQRLATIQRGEQKTSGPDVPKPLRGKGRRNKPAAGNNF